MIEALLGKSLLGSSTVDSATLGAAQVGAAAAGEDFWLLAWVTLSLGLGVVLLFFVWLRRDRAGQKGIAPAGVGQHASQGGGRITGRRDARSEPTTVPIAEADRTQAKLLSSSPALASPQAEEIERLGHGLKEFAGEVENRLERKLDRLERLVLEADRVLQGLERHAVAPASSPSALATPKHLLREGPTGKGPTGKGPTGEGPTPEVGSSGARGKKPGRIRGKKAVVTGTALGTGGTAADPSSPREPKEPQAPAGKSVSQPRKPAVSAEKAGLVVEKPAASLDAASQREALEAITTSAREKVLLLGREGHAPDAIAQEVRLRRGEVDLILRLQRTSERSIFPA